MTPEELDTLARIKTRLGLVEAALERAFRDGGAAALAADLRYLGVADISIDGRPLEQIAEHNAHQLTRKLREISRAVDRAVAELGDGEGDEQA